MASSSATKPELRSALDAIEAFLKQSDAAEEEVKLASAALQARFVCDYDAIRQRALDLSLLHIQRLLAADFGQLFYSCQKTLNTQNKPFNSVIQSETSRHTMLTILLKLIIHLEKEAEVLKEAVLPLL